MFNYHWVIFYQRITPLNQLLVRYIFQQKYKHVFTLYVIPPPRHDRGGWDASSYKERAFLFNSVNLWLPI